MAERVQQAAAAVEPVRLAQVSQLVQAEVEVEAVPGDWDWLRPSPLPHGK